MTRRPVACGVMVTTAALLTMGGCGGGGGDDGGVTNPPPPAAVATVSVTLSAGTINVGQTSVGTAVTRDAQNNVLSGRSVSWSSSNASVASVSGAGVVTGVTGGTANIIATSEGRTGQATITVAAPTTPPVISGLTISQNGQAVNLNQVAGTIRLSFNLDAPAGFTGNVIVKIDTAEVYRQPMTAFAVAASGGSVASPIVVGSTADVNTAQTTVNVTAQQISELPVVGNGVHDLILQIAPTGGQPVQQTTRITTANPMHAHGLGSFSGLTVVGTDGKTYTGGDGTAAVVFAKYDGETINSFEVTLTDVGPQYGQGTGGTVNSYQRITRTDEKTFILPTALVEKANLTYVMTKVVSTDKNGVTTTTIPQVGNFGNAQFTTDLIHSGWANTAQQVQGVTAPAGVTFQLVDQLSTNILPANLKTRWTIDAAYNLDNVGPKQSSPLNQPVFTFAGRETNTGATAFSPTYGYGAINNQLSPSYNFSGGFRSDRLTDITNIDQARTAFYFGPIADKQNLYTSQYLVGTGWNPAESQGARPYLAGARAFDGRGNSSDFWLTTSASSPWNINGQASFADTYGIDWAAIGFNRTRASMDIVGPPAKSTWNQSTIDPTLSWSWTVANSVAGMPNGFLSGRGKLNGTYGLGAGPLFDMYRVLPSNGGANSGSATFPIAPAISEIYGKVGGASNQGLYEFDFNAADNSGLFAAVLADTTHPRKFQWLFDYTSPTNALVTYTPGTPTAGQPATGTITGADNWGLKYARLGIRFNFSSSLFFGGLVYVPLAEIPISKQQDGTPTKNLSMPIMGTGPDGFSFYNGTTGNVDVANFYRSNGVSIQLEDYAHNLSSITFAPFNSSSTAPNIRATSVRSSISTTSWCPGTCAGGGQNFVDLIFNYLDPLSSGALELSKAEWFAIPQNGQVWRLGRSISSTINPEGSGRRVDYSFRLDLKDYCGPSGPALVFAVGYNTSYYLKTNPFYSVNILSPNRYSNTCNNFTF